MKIMAEDEEIDPPMWDGTSALSRIARAHFALFNQELAEAKRLQEFVESEGDTEDDDLTHQSWECETRAADHAKVVITFAAFAIESHINSYGARRLGERYFKNHLDKLDTVSKWIIIPRVVAGRRFPKDHNVFDLLTKLFSYRNEIVHPKSTKIDMAKLEKEAKNRFAMEKKFLEFVPKAIELLSQLKKVAAELDPKDQILRHEL